MATSYYTSDTLIDSVKRRQSVPDSQITFEDEDFLAFANEEIAMGILPTILQFHQEYLVYTQEIPLEANKSSYPIPNRAIGAKLRHLHYEDSSGDKFEMSRILREDEPYYQNSSVGSSISHFYIENNMIVLVPEVADTISGSLVASYFMRPNQLVLAERAGVISAINTNTGVVTVDAVPSGMTTASLVDFVETKGGHRSKAIDLAPSAVSGTTLTFDPEDLPDDLVVGDYVCFAEETVIPQIPDDLHVMLAERVAARCLEALGDQAGLQAANTKLQEMEMKTSALIDNRVEGTPTKVVNLRGPLSRRVRRR
jgi:hypothetical protein